MTKTVQVTDEQIAAIGALTSLGEAMGHEVITKIARDFLGDISKTYQVAQPFAMNRDTDRRVGLIFGSKAAADEWMDNQRRTKTRDMSWGDPSKGCDRPPQGWWCSREAGHEGPCAARQIDGTQQSEADKLLEALEPFMEALVCYASTMGEHAGNRLAYEVERYFQNKADYEKPLILFNAMTPMGQLCRAYRIAIGSSLYAQSMATGIRPAALSAIEFGRREMTDAELYTITQFFERHGLTAGQNFAIALRQR